MNRRIAVLTVFSVMSLSTGLSVFSSQESTLARLGRERREMRRHLGGGVGCCCRRKTVPESSAPDILKYRQQVRELSNCKADGCSNDCRGFCCCLGDWCCDKDDSSDDCLDVGCFGVFSCIFDCWHAFEDSIYICFGSRRDMDMDVHDDA